MLGPGLDLRELVLPAALRHLLAGVGAIPPGTLCASTSIGLRAIERGFLHVNQPGCASFDRWPKGFVVLLAAAADLWWNPAEICKVMLLKTALPGKSQTSERYESPNFFNRRCLVQG